MKAIAMGIKRYATAAFGLADGARQRNGLRRRLGYLDVGRRAHVAHVLP